MQKREGMGEDEENQHFRCYRHQIQWGLLKKEWSSQGREREQNCLCCPRLRMKKRYRCFHDRYQANCCWSHLHQKVATILHYLPDIVKHDQHHKQTRDNQELFQNQHHQWQRSWCMLTTGSCDSRRHQNFHHPRYPMPSLILVSLHLVD